MIQKHIDLIAIGALLFGMAVFSHTRRVWLVPPVAPLRIQVPPPASAGPVVVVPHIPRIIVNL